MKAHLPLSFDRESEWILLRKREREGEENCIELFWKKGEGKRKSTAFSMETVNISFFFMENVSENDFLSYCS